MPNTWTSQNFLRKHQNTLTTFQRLSFSPQMIVLDKNPSFLFNRQLMNTYTLDARHGTRPQGYKNINKTQYQNIPWHIWGVRTKALAGGSECLKLSPAFQFSRDSTLNILKNLNYFEHQLSNLQRQTNEEWGFSQGVVVFYYTCKN